MILDTTPASIADFLSTNASTVHANNHTAELVEMSLARKETTTTRDGALVATTGAFTGRSPKDKYIVGDPTTNERVWWENNARMDKDKFDLLLADLTEYAKGKELFVQQLHIGADSNHRLEVSVVSESAWHSLFIRHLLITPAEGELAGLKPNVCVVHLPSFKVDPARHGTRTETCIALDVTRNIILIAGSFYAGEIKKSVFSLYNFHAPEHDVFPMHCSANVGPTGDFDHLFRPQSGTGKTTLSASADRALVGDDEHGWGPGRRLQPRRRVLRQGDQPVRGQRAGNLRCGAPARAPSWKTSSSMRTACRITTDDSLTENTRIAYPLTAIANRVDSGTGAGAQACGAAGRRRLRRVAAAQQG